MLDAVRQIGVFMIAAQAVVHFAPGRQYEKYIKSVSGMILLLLFLKPVLQLAGAVWEEPQMLWEQWEEMTNMSDFSKEPQINDVTQEVVGRMESEMKERLNRELETDRYFVSSLSIRFIQGFGAEADTLLPQVEITLRKRAEEEENAQIEIEKIEIEQPGESASDVSLLSYRTRFASILGMEEERVEVRRDGRG